MTHKTHLQTSQKPDTIKGNIPYKETRTCQEVGQEYTSDLHTLKRLKQLKYVIKLVV